MSQSIRIRYPWVAMIMLVLFATYAPFSWIFFLTHNRDAWMKLWPILPGWAFTFSLGILGAPFQKLTPLALPFTIILPTLAFLLMSQFPNRRYPIAIGTLLFFTLLSLAAYAVYLA